MRKTVTVGALAALLIASWLVLAPRQPQLLDLAVKSVSPPQSIGTALTGLRAGDTLIVHGGTYDEAVNVTMSPGTQAAPITVEAAPGERPVVMGLFWVKNAVWTNFIGINVTWGSASGSTDNHMTKMTGGSNWTFTNAELWGAKSYANLLVTGTAASWQVANNCIHDNLGSHGSNQDHNIYVSTSASGSIHDNTLFDATGGRNIKLGPGSGTGGPANVTIANNRLWNSAQGISLSYGTNGTSIHDNTIAKTTTGDLIDPNNLAGAGNTAQNNVGWQSATGKFIGDTTVKDLGGNVFVTPTFTSLACSAPPAPTPPPSAAPVRPSASAIVTPRPSIPPSIMPSAVASCGG